MKSSKQHTKKQKDS